MGSHTLFFPHCILIPVSTDIACPSLMVDLKAKTSQNFGNEHSISSVNKILFTRRDNVQVQVSVYLEYFWRLLIFLLFIISSNSLYACTAQQGRINNSDKQTYTEKTQPQHLSLVYIAVLLNSPVCTAHSWWWPHITFLKPLLSSFLDAEQFGSAFTSAPYNNFLGTAQW